MNYLDNVFAEFKDGDNQQQLELYLHHRDLRAEFDQIENEETTSMDPEPGLAQQVVIKPGRTKDQQSPFVKLKRWCFSILS